MLLKVRVNVDGKFNQLDVTTILYCSYTWHMFFYSFNVSTFSHYIPKRSIRKYCGYNNSRNGLKFYCIFCGQRVTWERVRNFVYVFGFQSDLRKLICWKLQLNGYVVWFCRPGLIYSLVLILLISWNFLCFKQATTGVSSSCCSLMNRLHIQACTERMKVGNVLFQLKIHVF
jgi:hypothetical protein